MNFAIVKNSIVVNVVVADTAQDTTWIPCDGLPAVIGGEYTEGVFHLPFVANVPPTVSDKEIMWERIKAERDRRKLNGVFVSGKWIHTDVFSRTQWMAMMMMGASIPSIPWTTMDYSTINTTQALAQQVFAAVATLDSTLFAQATAHRTAMELAPNPLTYDFSAGWQATFEG